MGNQPPHNQVWIHPDGTWSSMRRDGSFNFIYAVPIVLQLKSDGTCEMHDDLPRVIEVEGGWDEFDGSPYQYKSKYIRADLVKEGDLTWVNPLTESERACVRMGADPRNFLKG